MNCNFPKLTTYRQVQTTHGRLLAIFTILSLQQNKSTSRNFSAQQIKPVFLNIPIENSFFLNLYLNDMLIIFYFSLMLPFLAIFVLCELNKITNIRVVLYQLINDLSLLLVIVLKTYLHIYDSIVQGIL